MSGFNFIGANCIAHSFEELPMNEYQRLAVEALNRMFDDDFVNCCQAFQRDPVKPNGKSSAEFVAEFKLRKAKITAAINWVKAIVNSQHGEMNYE